MVDKSKKYRNTSFLDIGNINILHNALLSISWIVWVYTELKIKYSYLKIMACGRRAPQQHIFPVLRFLIQGLFYINMYRFVQTLSCNNFDSNVFSFWIWVFLTIPYICEKYAHMCLSKLVKCSVFILVWILKFYGAGCKSRLRQIIYLYCLSAGDWALGQTQPLKSVRLINSGGKTWRLSVTSAQSPPQPVADCMF